MITQTGHALNRTWIEGRPARPLRSGPVDLRYRRLLGEEAWSRLPQATRNRFSQFIGPKDAELFRGCVEETRFSLPGRILAICLSPFAAALPTEPCEIPVAASVSVTQGPDADTQIWTRCYNRTGRYPQVILSQKRFGGPTGLEEQVGHNIGMTLRVSEQNKGLVFESETYFLALFGFHIALPGILTPGQIRVEHRDAGDGAFDFILTLTHPLFGELLYQRARFHDMKEA